MRDEHRAAIEWMNTHFDKNISLFLVRPEVLKINNSLPALRFHVEAAPSEFTRRLRDLVDNEDAPRYEFRRAFWESLLQYLSNNGHLWAKGRNTTKENWISSFVGKSGVNVNMSMAQGSRIRVEIYCPHDSEKQMFEKLLAQKGKIEEHFPGENVSWERMEDGAASRVAVYRPYDKEEVTEDTAQRRELYDWICKSLTAFRSIAKQLLVDKQASE